MCLTVDPHGRSEEEQFWKQDMESVPELASSICTLWQGWWSPSPWVWGWLLSCKLLWTLCDVLDCHFYSRSRTVFSALSQAAPGRGLQVLQGCLLCIVTKDNLKYFVQWWILVKKSAVFQWTSSSYILKQKMNSPSLHRFQKIRVELSEYVMQVEDLHFPLKANGFSILPDMF